VQRQLTLRYCDPNCDPNYDLCKFYFTDRFVSEWNSLPNYVVSANTLNCYTNRLDKYSSNQDYYAPLGKEVISIAFVRPSVRLSTRPSVCPSRT